MKKFSILLFPIIMVSLFVSLLFLACGTADDENSNAIPGIDGPGKVIYGTDDRRDIYTVSDQQIVNNADGVVSLFKSSGITDNGNGTSTLSTSNYGTAKNLCAVEPFRAQPRGAFCSGFLVENDLVATAGHCVNTNNVITTRFVFGFRMTNASTAQTVINNNEIYQGASIVRRQEDGIGADFALVRLTRAVSNHRVLAIRRSGTVAVNEGLYVIGHPSGIPVKYAGNANVRSSSNPNFFVANLDTYGGNSGSPIFNARTHVVEGILVRGETDFTYNSAGRCYVSNSCTDTGCRGEDVTKTTVFMNNIAALFRTPCDIPGINITCCN